MTITEIKPCLELKTLDAYRYFRAKKFPKYEEMKKILHDLVFIARCN